MRHQQHRFHLLSYFKILIEAKYPTMQQSSRLMNRYPRVHPSNLFNILRSSSSAQVVNGDLSLWARYVPGVRLIVESWSRAFSDTNVARQPLFVDVGVAKLRRGGSLVAQIGGYHLWRRLEPTAYVSLQFRRNSQAFYLSSDATIDELYFILRTTVIEFYKTSVTKVDAFH